MSEPPAGPAAPGPTGTAPAGGDRRPVVFQEAVAPARVFGVWPVAILAAVAVVVAVVATAAVGHLRHGPFWWLPGGAWVAVGIGLYGSWHVRRHRRLVLAREAAEAGDGTTARDPAAGLTTPG